MRGRFATERLADARTRHPWLIAGVSSVVVAFVVTRTALNVVGI
jgi:hypothetical protein